jgi:hypothetical protein
MRPVCVNSTAVLRAHSGTLNYHCCIILGMAVEARVTHHKPHSHIVGIVQDNCCRNCNIGLNHYKQHSLLDTPYCRCKYNQKVLVLPPTPLQCCSHWTSKEKRLCY